VLTAPVLLVLELQTLVVAVVVAEPVAQQLALVRAVRVS